MTIGLLLDRPRRLVHHVRSTPPRLQTRREETANAITHGIGLFASLIAGPLVVAKGVQSGDWVTTIACLSFAVPLVGVYLCSTVSHALADAKFKIAWERWDRATIYLLIAGSFTPYAAAYLRHDYWPMLTLAMWILAACGFMTKVLFHHHLRKANIWMYVALGWLPTIALPTMIAQMDPTCVQWTVASGLCYTFGTLFLMYDRAAPFLHVCWHLAVLAGTAFHFAAVYVYVVKS